MTDVHSPEVRSYNMSRIKGKDTKPEMLVRRFLFSKGLRYKLHDRSLPGKPDLVFPKYKSVVFVHGCFWHGHEGCRYFVPPKTRSDWWQNKINGNRKKDNENMALLNEMAWNVIIIWECMLKADEREKTLHGLVKELKGK